MMSVNLVCRKANVLGHTEWRVTYRRGGEVGEAERPSASAPASSPAAASPRVKAVLRVRVTYRPMEPSDALPLDIYGFAVPVRAGKAAVALR